MIEAYKVVGLMYTRTCPLACRDCIVESSPKVREKMQQSVASNLIKTIPKYSDAVCFTGGEPMLYYNEVLPLIYEAKALGLVVTLVTGAGWVRTNKEHIARERIFGLKEAGLDGLFISWDVYHEEFSPPENALLLLELAKQAELRTMVRGVLPATGAVARIEEKLVNINVPYQTNGIVRMGAARNLPDDHFHFTAEPHPGRCQVVFSPVIEPNGNVFACCGPSRDAHRSSPLFLGNISEESLDSIFHRAVRDPIIEALSTIGPYGLFNLIKDEPSLRNLLPRRDRYTTMCEVCLDINDIPEVVSQIRKCLASDDARTLLLAAKLYHKAPSEMKTTPIGTM